MTVADVHLSPPLAAPAVTVLNGSQLGGDVVGGKAAAIDRLIAWAIPVPPTAVVTTTAYRAVCESSSLTALFEQLGQDANLAAAAVDAAFTRAGLPADVAEQVRDAALTVSGGRHVAVRSSATVEDMGTSSFAGQYHSVLDVDPADTDALTNAVLSVFASLFHPAPRAYRKALGIGDTGVAMAALIMPMIPAVRAGVVFTQDPTAPAGTARIETVDGLAEHWCQASARLASCPSHREQHRLRARTRRSPPYWLRQPRSSVTPAAHKTSNGRGTGADCG
jgi:phosphoenolpyruvate synthase/pyruvate phosphate dikinase